MKTKKLIIFLVLTELCVSMFISNAVSPGVNENREQRYVEILVFNYPQNNSLTHPTNYDSFDSPASISNENSNINCPCVDIFNVSEENLKNTVQTLQDFDTRYVFSENCSSSAEWIYSRFSEYGLWTEYDYFEYENHTLKNVVGTLNGTSDNIYIISAHYDSINLKDEIKSTDDVNASAPGADDDASGVAGVLESARIMSNYRFNATIRFVAFSAEEEGLIGSSYYAEKMKSNNEKIIADIQLDMIGYGNDSIDIIANPESEWIAETMENVSVNYEIGLDVNKVVNPDFKCSDHASFWSKGYCGVCCIENATPWNSNPYFHSKNDTIDKLNFTLIKKTTQLCIATLVVLANISFPENVNKYALLIGIEDYPGSGNDLDYTVDDVYDMCDVLINNCYFDPANIRVLTDANATKTNIQNNIAWVSSNAKPDDTVIFFFSGHGGHDYVLVYGNTISDNELDLWFSDINSTNLVIIIDSCYAGSMIEKSKSSYSDEVKNFSSMQGVKNEKTKKVGSFAKGLGQSGRIVLAACTENQYSWEYDELSNGVFTYYLIEGLKSASADNNSNGWVSAEEAFYYAKPRTYEFNDSDNPAGGQNPQIYDGIEGEIDLSSYGDLIISDAEVYSNINLTLNKNLTITCNGSLTLNNVILMMNSSVNGEHHIEVQSGGQLYIYNSNISSANEFCYLFWVRNNSKFEIKDSEVSGCGWDLNNKGLTVEASNVHISNCTFSNNYMGIIFYQSKHNSMENCVVSSNNYIGIYMEDSFYSEIIGCNVSDNRGGIYLKNSPGNTISNCTISSNNDVGVSISFSEGVTISECNISSNMFGGIDTFNSSTWISSTIISNNGNKGTSGGEGGILCADSSLTIINTKILSNYRWGIYFQDSSTMIIDSIVDSTDVLFPYPCSVGCSGTQAILVNSTISGNSSDVSYRDICFYSDSDLDLVNTTFNKSRVFFHDSYSTLNVSWYLNVNVTWKNNISAEYADVTIIDNLTNEVFNCSTDEDGKIKNIIVQEYIKNQTTTTYFTPYTITASKNGYYGFATAEMNQNMEIPVYLKDITPPNADAGNDREIDKNTTVYFDGSNSTDNSGVITNYTWTFADNGVEVMLYGISPNYAFHNSGVFVVTLNVTDGSENWNTDTVNIKVKDRTPPNANAGEDQVVSHGITMRFDGSNSTDNVGIVNYTWSFFDNINITLYGVSPEYVFLTLGTHIITLSVKDEAGNSDTDTINIIVKDATKPSIKIVSPEPVVHSRDCTVKCVVTDNVKVERVEVGLNNRSWSSCIRENTDEYTATLILDKGENTIYIRATDSSGNVNTTSITVFVETPEDVFPVFTSNTIMLLIGIIFCITLTIILERKPKRKSGL